jgi:hypothetical protein
VASGVGEVRGDPRRIDHEAAQLPPIIGKRAYNGSQLGGEDRLAGEAGWKGSPATRGDQVELRLTDRAPQDQGAVHLGTESARVRSLPALTRRPMAGVVTLQASACVGESGAAAW